jgi:hypothetical protein
VQALETSEHKREGIAEVTMFSTAESVDESDEPMGKDEYGIIPRFEQIDKQSRSAWWTLAKVTEVLWNGKPWRSKNIQSATQ